DRRRVGCRGWCTAFALSMGTACCMRKQAGLKTRFYGLWEEKSLNQVFELGDRLRRIHTDAELRAALEALGIPGAERAQLVDHPAFAAECLAAFGHVLGEQQLHVVEQELSALFRSDLASGPSFHEIVSLRKNPRIAQHAAANVD